MEVKAVNDTVLVTGLASQANALHLCSQIQQFGVKSTIGMLPGMPGYQVSIYRVGIDDVKAMLSKLGIKAQRD